MNPADQNYDGTHRFIFYYIVLNTFHILISHLQNILQYINKLGLSCAKLKLIFLLARPTTSQVLHVNCSTPNVLTTNKFLSPQKYRKTEYVAPASALGPL